MINAPSLFLFVRIKISLVMGVLPYNQQRQIETQTNYNKVWFSSIHLN